MKLQKKHIIAGTIGLITISGALLYLQFQRLKEYCVSVNKIKLNGFSAKKCDIDLVLNFVNKSSLKLTIYSQQYLVYVKNSFVTKVSNAIPQTIKPNSTSLLAVKLQFVPEKILNIAKTNILEILTKPETTTIKIATTMKVGFGIFKFNVNFDYVTTVKELMTSSDPNNSANKC